MNVMEIIRLNDPDGGSIQPTEKDYKEFRNWVLNTYGENIFQRYFKTSWDE